MRILVEHGSRSLDNVGDIAQLQSSLGRLRALFPRAALVVPTSSPERLANLVPDARPHHERGFVARASRSSSWLRGVRQRSFEQRLRHVDLLVVAGGGFLNSSFPRHARNVAELALAAFERDIPVAFFGQMIGPFNNEVLRRSVSEALQVAGIVSLRMGTSEKRGLRSLGIADDRLYFTGDEALAVLSSSPTTSFTGDLGLNVRTTGYANVNRSRRDRIIGVVRRASVDHGLALSWCPIALHRDGDTPPVGAASPVGIFNAPPTTAVELMIQRIGGLRLLVTGSYHAAVFAVGQGVPVVALSASPYYDQKFADLASYFPDRVTVVDLLSEKSDLALKVSIDHSIDLGVIDASATVSRLVSSSAASYLQLPRLVSF